MSQHIEQVDVSPDEAECRFSDSGLHCNHWWDGGACCGCKAPPMTEPPERRVHHIDGDE